MREDILKVASRDKSMHWIDILYDDWSWDSNDELQFACKNTEQVERKLPLCNSLTDLFLEQSVWWEYELTKLTHG